MQDEGHILSHAVVEEEELAVGKQLRATAPSSCVCVYIYMHISL